MNDKKLKRNLLIYMLFFGILIGLTIIPNFIGASKATGNDENETPPDAYIENITIHFKQMVRDPNFDLEQSYSPWSLEEDGDITDVDGNLNNKEANYEVVGDERTFSEINGIPNTDWISKENPDFPAYPDSYNIDSEGCWASHDWSEGPKQTPSVQWVQNFTMPVNMSDYIITSANITSIFNASVDINVDVNPDLGDTISGSDNRTRQGVVYDFVRFYVSIADTSLENIYEIAHYQSYDLGLHSVALDVLEIEDYMSMILEENLIYYLTSVLSYDYENFTVILGMNIFCEDNCHSDLDYWDMLRIKNVNFTFTYEKKIDQLTSESLKQTGNRIDNGEYELGDVGFFIINNASLNFDYTISQTWPSSSINSEIRIYFNKVLLSKTIKLTTFSTAVQHESFDISPSLINEAENISLDVQLFIADNFHLSENITISIDNVNLTTGFTVVERNIPEPTVLDTIPTFVLYIMGVIIAGLIVSFVAYQQYFRFPKAIREIRSLGRAIRKGKAAEKALSVKAADDLFVQDYISRTKGLLPSKNKAMLKDHGAPGSVPGSIAKGDKKGVKDQKTKLKETKIEEKQKITPKISKEEKKPDISKKPSSLEDSLELPKAEQPIKVEPTQKIEKLKSDQFVKPHNIEDSDLKSISMDQKPKKIRYLRKPKIKELPKKKTDKK